METRTTHRGRTRFLYFVPLVPLVMGLVLIAIDEANLFPWDQSHPSSTVGYDLWTGEVRGRLVVAPESGGGAIPTCRHSSEELLSLP